MRRARIGKLFHLTPLVDSLGDAEYFFDRVFSPLCMMRNWSDHWYRHAAIYIIGETSIEPMECLPGPGDQRTSWFRYVDRFGPRVHNLAFYVDNIEDLAQRLEEAGVRITDGGSGPRDGVLPPEGHTRDARVPPRHRGPVGAGRPALRPEWPAFRDAYWSNHPLGLQRMSHITIVVDDLPAAEKFYVDVLDAAPLPDQAATVPEGRPGTWRSVRTRWWSCSHPVTPTGCPTPATCRGSGRRSPASPSPCASFAAATGSITTRSCWPRRPTTRSARRRRRPGAASTRSPTRPDRRPARVTPVGERGRQCCATQSRARSVVARSTSSSLMP